MKGIIEAAKAHKVRTVFMILASAAALAVVIFQGKIDEVLDDETVYEGDVAVPAE